MKTLILDIETSPHKMYIWHPGKQYVRAENIVEAGHTLCWAAKWRGDKDIMFGSVWGDGKKRMLKRMWNLINKADVIIHFNGEKFDVPTLNKEFLLAKMGPPAPYRQVDVIKTLRRRFRFASNALDHVAQRLGLGRKVQHKGMALWHDVMRGVATAKRTMERYNKHDVRLTEKVYERVLPWIPNHPNAALYMDDDKPVCPSCGAKNPPKRGYAYTTTGKYQRYQCTGCGFWPRGSQNLLTPAKRKAMLRT